MSEDTYAGQPLNQCSTCRYAQNRTIGDGLFHCRRYPPTWTGHAGHAVTPIMWPDDWCGEYAQGAPAPAPMPAPARNVQRT